MVGSLKKFFRRRPRQYLLYLQRRFAACQTCPVADAKNVGIDRDGRLAECRVQNHIRGLPSNAAPRFEVLAIIGDLAAVAFEQQPAGFENVFRVGNRIRRSPWFSPGTRNTRQ